MFMQCGVCLQRKLDVRGLLINGVRVLMGLCHDCDVRHCHYGATAEKPSGCSEKVHDTALNARCPKGHLPV